ncbi:MAG: MBL fold metallo-hydrolase [Verrucomicrobia bacterium]|nr:MBL fold metallo-hydrolase [Verrucomicrobiota bacterium]
MSALNLEYHQGGLYLPRLALWLDPPKAKPGPVFVSHAHSDHTARHPEVIVSDATARLMHLRLGGRRTEHVLAFGEAREFQVGEVPFRITLLPAGHILGSAMAWVEAGGETLLYTGDFKLRPGLAAESCELRPADVLVMETTFGRPGYVFPPAESVWPEIVRFCRDALDTGATPVLLAYSLGKSQEILCGLKDAGFEFALHEQTYRLTRLYEELGVEFSPGQPRSRACESAHSSAVEDQRRLTSAATHREFEVRTISANSSHHRFQAAEAKGKVVLWPPGALRAKALQELGAVRRAVVTGWALDSSCRYRHGVEAAFPLSDHADFPGLLEAVERVRPRKVWTLHGYAAEFADVLRHRGYDALALSEPDQLTLALGS